MKNDALTGKSPKALSKGLIRLGKAFAVVEQQLRIIIS